MADIFISYSREDRAVAEALASILQRRGLSVWWDVELIPADRFREVINREIESCYVALVIWSETSRESNFVLDEANLALDQSKLIQTSTDGEKPPLGFGAASTQYSDLSHWKIGQPDAEIEKLLEAIEQSVPARDTVESLKRRINSLELEGKSRLSSSKAWIAITAILGLSGLSHSLFSAYVSGRPVISAVEINRVASNIKSDQEFLDVTASSLARQEEFLQTIRTPLEEKIAQVDDKSVSKEEMSELLLKDSHFRKEMSSSCRIVIAERTYENGWAESSKAQCAASEVAVGGGCSASSASAGSIGRLLNNKLNGYECIVGNPSPAANASRARVSAQAVCCTLN